MPFDFQRSRVDTSGLEKAAGAGEVIETGSAANQARIRATSAAYGQAGAAIGQGLAGIGKGIGDAADPTKALAKAQATMQSKAAIKDMEQRTLAENFPTSQALSRRQLAGSNLPPDDTVIRKAFKEEYGNSIDYDQLDGTSQDQIGQAYRDAADYIPKVHSGGPEERKKLGLKYNQPEITGVSVPETLAAGVQEFKQALRELPQKNRLFHENFVDATDNNKIAIEARAAGMPFVAEGMLRQPNKIVRKAMMEVGPYWKSNKAGMFIGPKGPEASTLQASAWKNRHRLTEWLQENTTNMADVVPRIGITRAGGKRFYDPVAGADLLKGLNDFEKERMQPLIQGSVVEYNNELQGLRASKDVADAILRGDWAKTPEQQVTLGKLKNLMSGKSESGTVTMNQVQDYLARRLGFTTVAPPAGTGNLFEDEKGLGAFKKQLESMEAGSDELRQLTTSSDTEPTHADKLRAEKLAGSYESGEGLEGNAGPLSFLKKLGVGEADAAIAIDSFIRFNENQPYFKGLKDQMGAMGFTPEQIEEIAPAVYPTLEGKIDGFIKGWNDNGKRFGDYTVPEQHQLLRGVADDVLKEHQAIVGQDDGVASKAAAAKFAGTDSRPIMKQDAINVVAARLKKDPALATGLNQAWVTPNGGFQLSNGKPVAILRKNAKGKMLSEPFTDQAEGTQETATAFALARRIYDHNSKGKTQQEMLATATEKMSLGVGHPIADEFLRQTVTPDGFGSRYMWLIGALDKSAGDMTPENAATLRTGLQNFAAERGVSPFRLREVFQQAADATDDPVADGVANFLEQTLWPQKDKPSHLDVHEGLDATRAAKAVGKSEYRKEATDGFPGGGDPLSVAQDGAAQKLPAALEDQAAGRDIIEGAVTGAMTGFSMGGLYGAGAGLVAGSGAAAFGHAYPEVSGRVTPEEQQKLKWSAERSDMAPIGDQAAKGRAFFEGRGREAVRNQAQVADVDLAMKKAAETRAASSPASRIGALADSMTGLANTVTSRPESAPASRADSRAQRAIDIITGKDEEGFVSTAPEFGGDAPTVAPNTPEEEARETQYMEWLKTSEGKAYLKSLESRPSSAESAPASRAESLPESAPASQPESAPASQPESAPASQPSSGIPKPQIEGGEPFWETGTFYLPYKGGVIVVPDTDEQGNEMSYARAKERYAKTGTHFGYFDNRDEARVFARDLIKRSTEKYGPEAQQREYDDYKLKWQANQAAKKVMGQPVYGEPMTMFEWKEDRRNKFELEWLSSDIKEAQKKKGGPRADMEMGYDEPQEVPKGAESRPSSRPTTAEAQESYRPPNRTLEELEDDLRYPPPRVKSAEELASRAEDSDDYLDLVQRAIISEYDRLNRWQSAYRSPETKAEDDEWMAGARQLEQIALDEGANRDRFQAKAKRLAAAAAEGERNKGKLGYSTWSSNPPRSHFLTGKNKIDLSNEPDYDIKGIMDKKRREYLAFMREIDWLNEHESGMTEDEKLDRYGDRHFKHRGLMFDEWLTNPPPKNRMFANQLPQDWSWRDAAARTSPSKSYFLNFWGKR